MPIRYARAQKPQGGAGEQVSFSNESVDSALDVAVDAIARRARLLEAAEPEVARALRTLATNIHPGLIGSEFTRRTRRRAS